jgi:DnaK suppressor protein
MTLNSDSPGRGERKKGDNLNWFGHFLRIAPMTDALPSAELARLKRELEERRAKLRVEVKTQLDGSEDDRVVGLRNRIKESGEEWGVADGLAELDIAEVRHALAELNEVDLALARMRAGTYGECRDCGEPIALARLSAYPTATRCLACQERHEKKIGGPPLTAV